MRKLLVTLCILITTLALLASCSAQATLKTGDITLSNLDTVSEVLSENGLSNIDVFESWVENTDIEAKEPLSYGFTDADCRMTVMLLTGDDIKSKRVENEYTGSYLMFDMEAIENNTKFSILKPKEKLFTTLFGEMPIGKSGFENAFPENLKKYGIEFTGTSYSVISLVFKAYKEEEAFVGHTGILIPNGNEYLFIEKIAFSEPFRATVVKNEEELIAMLSERPDYRAQPDEPAPRVYRNDTYIGSLHSKKA